MMSPSFFNYLRFCYVRISPLFFGDKVIQSVTGTQQGCPLGPVGFALGIQHVLKQLKPLRLTLDTWYLDDGLLVGDAATVAAAYSQLTGSFAQCGLAVNAAKCLLWGPGGDLAVRRGCAEVSVIPWVEGSGITVLGIQ